MAAVEPVGHVARGQQEDQAGEEKREAGETEIQGSVGDGIDLPCHGHRLSLGAQDDRNSCQLISPEIAKAKCLHTP